MNKIHTIDWHGLSLQVVEDDDGIIDIGAVSVDSSLDLIEFLSSEESTCLEEITQKIIENREPAPIEEPPEEDDLPTFEPIVRSKPSGLDK